MLPESVGAVIAFLLLIAPGYVWDRWSARYTPELRTTALREAAHIVFSSLLPSTLAGAMLLPLWLRLLREEAPTLHLLAMALATSALACGLVAAWARFRFRHQRALTGEIVRGSTLFSALVSLPRRSGIAQVVVTATMQDGTLWRGVHAGHDVDPDESPRMLLLQPPLLRRNVGAAAAVTYEAHEYVLLPLEDLRSLQLTYLTGSSAPRGATPPPARRPQTEPS